MRPGLSARLFAPELTGGNHIGALASSFFVHAIAGFNVLGKALIVQIFVAKS